MTEDATPQFSLAYLAVFGTPPQRMIQIAAETGYDFVSLRIAPVTHDEPTFPYTTDRSFVAEVVRALDQYDLSVLDVELIRTDPGTEPSDWRHFIEIAGELGARHVVTQLPEPDVFRAVDLFKEICHLGAQRDLTIDLEFIPWTATKDLSRAIEIVKGADTPNGAVLVDTLHFARSGSSVNQLAESPRDLFNFIQLCDALDPWSVSEEEFITIARANREPPGRGDIDLKQIVEAMPAVPYALEVPNDIRRDELGVEGFALLLRETAEDFLEGVQPRASTGS